MICNTVSLLTTLFFVFTQCVSHTQDSLNIFKLEDIKLVKTLNDAYLIAENKDDNLSVRVYKLDNGSGSLHAPETHQVSFNILVAVSEYDEYPKQSLFEMGPFNNPEFKRWIADNPDSKVFEITHGWNEEKLTTRLKVSLDELKSLSK